MFSKIICFFMALISALTASVTAKTSDVIQYRDLPYGDNYQRQILDLYIPKSVQGDANMLLFIHGGAWSSGSKDENRETLANLSASGYVCAAINYRFCNEKGKASVADELDDITAALAKMKETAAKHGVNLKGVMLYGGSAGAHLSLLYGYSRCDEAPVKPVAVVALSPVADFNDMSLYDGSLRQLNPDMWTIDRALWCDLLTYMIAEPVNDENIGTQTEALKAISPIEYVNQATVPTIIAHGTLDTVLPYEGAVRLHEKLTACGVENELITFEGAWHGLQDCPDGSAKLHDAFNRYLMKYVNTAPTEVQ